MKLNSNSFNKKFLLAGIILYLSHIICGNKDDKKGTPSDADKKDTPSAADKKGAPSDAETVETAGGDQSQVEEIKAGDSSKSLFVKFKEWIFGTDSKASTTSIKSEKGLASILVFVEPDLALKILVSSNEIKDNEVSSIIEIERLYGDKKSYLGFKFVSGDDIKKLKKGENGMMVQNEQKMAPLFFGTYSYEGTTTGIVSNLALKENDDIYKKLQELYDIKDPKKVAENLQTKETSGDKVDKTEQPGKPTDGANKPEQPGKPTDGANKPEQPGKPTAGANKGEQPGKPTAGANKGEKPGKPTAGPKSPK